MRPFRCCDESLGPLVDVASRLQLRQAVLVADSSSAEALQWAGGLPFVLQNLQIASVVALEDVKRSPAATLNPFQLVRPPSVAVLTCSALGDVEATLRAMLPHVTQLVVLSTIPETAHGPAFSFEAFRASLLPAPAKVYVEYVPLMYAPLSEKDGADPSVFVLTHPTCAAAFPLMRTQLPATPATHVNEIAPADIPEASRRAFKLLAQVLAGILQQWRFQVKDHIFALGGTSLKVGHTLLHTLHLMQGECTPGDLKLLQPANLILIDRTLDLATPSSHQFSLLDRILQQLPKASTPPAAEHITQVAPLDAAAEHAKNRLSVPASWSGGVSVCHGQDPVAAATVRNLLSHGPVNALRELSTSLRAVAMDLIKSKATPTPEKTPKDQPLRGRDVVQRWLACIDGAYDPKVTWQHKKLLQLGLAVLETMGRMETTQALWSHVANIEKRYAQSRFQGAAEWILPEVADLVNRQGMVPDEPLLSLDAVLQLFVYAFAIAGNHEMEDYTRGMVRQALQKAILAHDGSSDLLPQDLCQLLMTCGSVSSKNQEPLPTEATEEDDEWGWDDDAAKAPPSLPTTASHAPATVAAVEAYVAHLLPVLEECGQLYHEVAPALASDFALGLLPQVVSQLVDPSCPTIKDLQHVTDASEQLARAGIDLLKSGLSVFGLSGQGIKGAPVVVPHLSTPGAVCVVFVIGGISAHEVQAIADVMKGRTDVQLILGSTTLSTPTTLLRHLVA
ncbi:hypothetical protein SDRG_00515 [Saprolegnia diclina VS20]|uniref:Sec1 family domain-containing protein 2 n=1 Tax=Saprolegnia diclina (strain VS20) TaxID=1156394 RepID=T0QX26_SAPDV|nr:hypothetical protein SDRG_00515 [Saprolegnia diclina VS20]EQC42794.1 hypothetical protein SDRG_00515 [Saprolegnia diclina VS20]|eukprot:XP_008604217.1 hypothetical protein SDRG_00515 [Saprolegnia diclina VS20]